MDIHGILVLQDALDMKFVDKVALQKFKDNLFLESWADVGGRVMFSTKGHHKRCRVESSGSRKVEFRFLIILYGSWPLQPGDKEPFC